MYVKFGGKEQDTITVKNWEGAEVTVTHVTLVEVEHGTLHVRTVGVRTVGVRTVEVRANILFAPGYWRTVDY